MLWLKRFELTTGRVLLVDSRALLGERLTAVAPWFSHVLPQAARQILSRAWQQLLALLHRAAAWGILTFEHALERVLSIIREKTTHSRRTGEASAFLRQVADHKKELQRSRAQRHIVE